MNFTAINAGKSSKRSSALRLFPPPAPNANQKRQKNSCQPSALKAPAAGARSGLPQAGAAPAAQKTAAAAGSP